MGILSLQFSHVVPRTSSGLCFCSCYTLVTFILALVFFPATVKQLGQKKYGLVRNTLSGVVDMDTVYVPGRYWIGFWKEFVEFPSTLNTIEFADEAPEDGVQHLMPLISRDKDGKRIVMDISLQYLIIQDEVGQLYREMTTLYEDVMIAAVRSQLTRVGNNFQVELVWQDYSAVNAMMQEACEVALRSRHATCWSLQVLRVRLEERYESALIRTQVMKQSQQTQTAVKEAATVRAKTQVILAEYSKNVTILNAQGDADVYELKNAATAQANQNIVQVEATCLDLIKDAFATVTDTTPDISDAELTSYQKLAMVQRKGEFAMAMDQLGTGIDILQAANSEAVLRFTDAEDEGEDEDEDGEERSMEDDENTQEEDGEGTDLEEGEREELQPEDAASTKEVENGEQPSDIDNGEQPSDLERPEDAAPTPAPSGA